MCLPALVLMPLAGNRLIGPTLPLGAEGQWIGLNSPCCWGRWADLHHDPELGRLEG
jgi:hypothetical protein